MNRSGTKVLPLTAWAGAASFTDRPATVAAVLPSFSTISTSPRVAVMTLVAGSNFTSERIASKMPRSGTSTLPLLITAGGSSNSQSPFSETAMSVAGRPTPPAGRRAADREPDRTARPNRPPPV